MRKNRIVTEFQDSSVVEASKHIVRLQGKANVVLYNPYSLSVAKINTNTDKLLTFCAIPRSYSVIVKRFLGSQHSLADLNSMRDTISSLVSDGFLFTDFCTNKKQVSWEKVDWYPDAPRTVALHVTYRCNLKCDYCYNQQSRSLGDPSELTVNQWSSIVADMISCGVRKFDVTGGEPLLRDDLLPVWQNAVDKGIEVVLLTNGVLIADEIVARRIKNSFSRVVISIDSYDHSEHDKHRGIGTHEKVLKAIAFLNSAGVLWTAKMVYNSDTCNSLSETRKFVYSLGAKNFAASIDATTVDEVSRTKAFLQRELDSIKDYSFLSLECGQKIAEENKPIKPFGQIRACGVARTECALDPAGNIFPCRALLQPELSGGNILEHGFDEIWNSSTVLKRFREFDYTSIKECIGCSFFNLCLGGCRGRAYERSGVLNGFAGEDICRYNKTVRCNQILTQVGER